MPGSVFTEHSDGEAITDGFIVLMHACTLLKGT